MKVLRDIKIVVRAAQPNSPDLPSTDQALSKLIAPDGRLVATMQPHSISNVLDFNKDDLSRFPIGVFTPADIFPA